MVLLVTRPLALLLLSLFLGLIGAPLSAQVEALDCLPPVVPAPVTDARLIKTYRDEIGEEYSAYFDAAQLYLLCLDAARSTLDAEMKAAIEAYQNLDAMAATR